MAKFCEECPVVDKYQAYLKTCEQACGTFACGMVLGGLHAHGVVVRDNVRFKEEIVDSLDKVDEIADRILYLGEEGAYVAS